MSHRLLSACHWSVISSTLLAEGQKIVELSVAFSSLTLCDAAGCVCFCVAPLALDMLRQEDVITERDSSYLEAPECQVYLLLCYSSALLFEL